MEEESSNSSLDKIRGGRRKSFTKPGQYTRKVEEGMKSSLIP